MVEVKNLEELKENNRAQTEIIISENIDIREPLILAAGVSLKGKNSSIVLSGRTKLIGLTKDNSIKDIRLKTDKDKETIFFDSKDTEGVFKLENIRSHGSISLISSKAKGDIEVNVENVNILEADVTHKKEGPEG